jgi:hypothetical protein
MIFRNAVLKSILLAFLIIPVLILNHAWAGETITGKVVSSIVLQTVMAKDVWVADRNFWP